MKYFLDSAKIDEIKFAYNTYAPNGRTKNKKRIKCLATMNYIDIGGIAE